jgi:hypothetical protein
MLVALAIVIATVSALLTARHEGDQTPQTRTEWARTIAFWTFTIVVAFEMVAGSLWDLLGIETVRIALTHLGFPHYLLYILGIPKLLCSAALLAPRLPRLKEWAYAGAIFNYGGAAASHLLADNTSAAWVAPLVFAAFTMASWALRPATRKSLHVTPATPTAAVTWYVPFLILAGMVAVALLTLPKPHRNESLSSATKAPVTSPLPASSWL